MTNEKCNGAFNPYLFNLHLEVEEWQPCILSSTICSISKAVLGGRVSADLTLVTGLHLHFLNI